MENKMENVLQQNFVAIWHHFLSFEISDQRRPYSEAKLMFEETEESIEKRLILSEQRKAQPTIWTSSSKPNKKQRRLIHEFKQRS